MMTYSRMHGLSFSFLLSLLVACGGGKGTSDGGPSDGAPADGGMDGSTTDGGTTDGGMDGSTDGSTTDGGIDGSTTDGGTDTGVPDGAVVLPDGGGVCFPAMCQGALRACGNCIDDDGDGLVDSADSNCLGPCDNNETGLYTDIPGGDTPSCGLDCYYDSDQGSGNDHCSWDGRCDPLSPDLTCPFETPRPPSAQCPATQDSRCIDNCRPLTPNGCDCFGCCDLPGGSGQFVFVGSLDAAGDPTCTLEAAIAHDTTACHPCTPVEGECFNACGRCELCLGRTEADLPADCFPPPPPVDGGTPSDGGTPVDSGTPSDSGTPPDAGPRCDPGVQACGLSSDPACPSGNFCLTGCCIFFG